MKRKAFVGSLILAFLGPAPEAPADPAAVCAAAGGTWKARSDGPGPRNSMDCELRTVLADAWSVDYAIPIKPEIVDDPWIASTMSDFIRQRFAHFRDGDAEWKPITPPNDGVHGITSAWYSADAPQVYQHGPNLRSLVFDEIFDSGGAHPNDEIFTFVFDFANRRLLKIDDLFKPGVDPRAVLLPLAKRHSSFPRDFDPGGWLDQKDNFTAFALTDTELQVYLPKGRVGACDAGCATAHIPLAELADALRPEILKP